MKVFLILFNVFLLARNVQSVDTRVDPLVLIDQGLVRGERSENGIYSSFLGIPYAEIDLENPFGASLAHSGFGDEVFNANDGSTMCPQPMTDDGTLDCLRLNIYVPTRASSRNPLPVLVFIHGGSYETGSAGLYGAASLMEQDIVVVTINYRLGAYGFMCLDVPSVPGNQGLKDQLTALRWIKQNIAAFGGNPYNVTLAGQSAGSSSVGYHLYSSQEKLFQKAILESGVPLTLSLYTKADEDAALKLAEHLGFNTTDTEKALKFLSKTTPNLVTAASRDLGLVLKPCKERSFSGVENVVESDPFTMSNPSKIKNTPILIGTTSNEPSSHISEVGNEDLFQAQLTQYFNLNAEELEKAAATIKHFYIGDQSISESILEELQHFLGDYIFDYPVDATITKLLNDKAGPVYRYVYNYVGENDEGYKDNAPHNAELKYLYSHTPETFNKEEKLISDYVTTLWANFVKYGDPTPQTSDLSVTWEPVTKDTRPYLKIDTELGLGHRWRKESMAFWDLFYTSYGQYKNYKGYCNLQYKINNHT